MPVISVTEDQIQTASGELQDVFDITFNIDNVPGSFTVQVVQSGDPIAAAHDAIAAKTAEVLGIYGL